LILPAEEVRDPAVAVFAVKLSNPAKTPAAYRLSAVDAGGNLRCQFDTPNLTVPANGEASTVLRVTPQTILPAGELVHTLQVAAQPASGAGPSLSGALRYIQTAGQPPSLAISPASQASPGPASYTVTVHNPRSAPIQVTLRAYDQGNQCQFALEPPSLSVPARGQASARLEVRPLGQLLPGETRRPFAFGVAGYASGDPKPFAAEGSLLLVHGFTWRKLLPLFIAFFVLLGLGAVAVIALLYMRFMQ